MAVLSKQAVAKAKAKVVKKPAIKQTTDLLRKPASSTSEKSEKTEKGGLNLTIDQLKAGNLGEEPRDKGKSVKYHKMKEAGQLPEYVIHLIEDQAKSAASKRSFQTSAINRLFTRGSDGSLALNLSDGLFTEAQTIHTKHFSRGSQKALPASVLKGLYFGNSQAAFDQAVASGDVVEVIGEDGKTYWGFQSYEVGREDGKSDSLHHFSQCSQL